MQSRMNRYQEKTQKRFERSEKNTKLYSDVYDDMYRDTTYKNMKIIDTAKEINLNKLKDILTDKPESRQYRTFKSYSKEDDEVETVKTSNKVYDINEIIDAAKNKRAFIEEAREKQKYMDFTQRRNVNVKDENIKDLMEIEKEEETTNVKSESMDALDILSDLKGSDNTIVTKPITSYEDKEIVEEDLPEKVYETEDGFEAEIERTLVKADKTFYTDSNMFTKNDFEDFNDLSKSLGKRSGFKTFLIILLILIILATIVYLALTEVILK